MGRLWPFLVWPHVAAVGLALAVWGTLSAPIRAAPSLDELAEPPAPETAPAAVEGLEPRS